MKEGCVFCDNKNFDKALEIHPLIKEQTGIHSFKRMLFPPEGFSLWLEVLLRLCTEASFEMILSQHGSISVGILSFRSPVQGSLVN